MEEFFKNVEFLDNGCWIWKGKTWAAGRYGVVTGLIVGNRSVSAHRMSYLMFNGLLGNLHVCHKCDVPLCVNPSHLFLGTASDNAKDALKKGRLTLFKGVGQKGEKNYCAKYSLEFAEKIRKYYADFGCSYGELARVFSLKSRGHAHAIVKHRIWN